MILTGPEIRRQMDAGRIHIRPFNEADLGPNSYDVRLGPKLLTYVFPHRGAYLDMRKKHITREVTIPEEGLILEPGQLYLGSTIETAVSSHYVPLLEGRSSIGRLGINTHVTAGFGDLGWGYKENPGVGPYGMECLYPTWTLEMAVLHRVRVYAGVRIAQVYFLKPEGELRFYKGKYSEQRAPEPSRLYEDPR